MGSFFISMALILVALFAVPIPLWISRSLGTLRRRRRKTDLGRPIGDGALSHLSASLREAARETRRTRALVEAARDTAREYRSTLPFISLFFARLRVSLSRDRWVTRVRDDYEQAVVTVSDSLWGWVEQVEDLPGRDQATLQRLGLSTEAVCQQLVDAFPESAAWARRLRFSGAPEVDGLRRSLATIARDLSRFESALLEHHAGSYR